MNLDDRNRRALSFLGVAIVLFFAAQYWSSDSTSTSNNGALASLPPQMLEDRLLRMRSLAAQAPAKEQVLEQVKSELRLREKGTLQGDTAAQAQAQLMQIARSIGRSVVPPVEVRPSELGRVTGFGKDYGEVNVTVQMDASMSQIVSFLAALGSQPELLATNEIRLGQASNKDKNISARVVISGIVPKKLVPEKKTVGY